MFKCKKVIIPAFAAIVGTAIAFGTSAFKNGFNRSDSLEKQKTTFAAHDFYYVPPTTGDYSQPSVQNKANWKSTADGDCGGDANKACKISVDDQYTRDSSGIRVFNLTGMIANISATAGAGGASNGYIPVTTSPSVGITGKTDKP